MFVSEISAPIVSCVDFCMFLLDVFTLFPAFTVFAGWFLVLLNRVPKTLVAASDVYLWVLSAVFIRTYNPNCRI